MHQAFDRTALTTLMSSIVASRAAMFALTQDLSTMTGEKIDPEQLWNNIDCHMPGRADVTTAEAEALLAVRDFEHGSWEADAFIQAAQLPQHIIRPSNPGQ